MQPGPLKAAGALTDKVGHIIVPRLALVCGIQASVGILGIMAAQGTGRGRRQQRSGGWLRAGWVQAACMHGAGCMCAQAR